MKNLFRYVGLRHIRLKPLRTFLTFLGVAFGVALYVAISMINASTRKTFRENVESVSGKSKFVISAGPTGFGEDKLEVIRKVEGVKAAVPMLENRAFLAGNKNASASLYVLGVDLLQEAAVRSYAMSTPGASGAKPVKRVIDDPLVFLNQPDSIIVTESFAKGHQLTMDSKLTLSTVHGNRVFTVRGLLDPEGVAKAYGGSLAIMDIDGARLMFGKEDKLDRVDILPTTDYDLDRLQKNLEAALGPGYAVEKPGTIGDNLENMVKSYQLILVFFSSLALLVGLFLIYNSTSVSIAERRREIGVLRALGASRRNILTLFMSEASVLGFAGAAFGLLLGRFLSGYLVDSVSTAISNQYGTPIRVSELTLTRDQILFTLSLGVITAAMAAFFPAFGASRIAPTEAMRSHGMETPRSGREGLFRDVAGFAMYAFALALMYFEAGRVWKWFDQVGQGCSVLGAAFFGPVLVFALIRVLRFTMRNSRHTIFRLAQENLLRSKARTSSNIMSLMVGLYFVMLVATVRASFHDTIIRWSEEVLAADLIVSASGRFITAEVQPIDPVVSEEFWKVPGLRVPGAGFGAATRVTKIPYGKGMVALKALDHPIAASNSRTIPIMGADRAATVDKFYAAKDPVILISYNFVLKHPEAKVGGMLGVDTPSGHVDFKILGIVRDYASPEGVFYVPRPLYTKIWHDTLVTAFGLYVEDPTQIEAVRTALDREVLSKHGLTAMSNIEVRRMMADVVDQSFAYTRAVEFAALLVALLGLLNTLLISVLERTREIGMIRALGSTRGQVGRLILWESLIQGGFGAVVATLLGGVVGYFYVTYALGLAMGWVIDFYVPVSSVLWTIATGVGVALVAGILPARRAARLKIVDALDAES